MTRNRLPKFIGLVGARPNFIKFAALSHAFAQIPEAKLSLVHTGQHRGELMSDVFFRELQMPQPDFFLNIGRKNAHQQIAQIISRFGKILLAEKPDAVLLVGDVNSTLAGAIAANKAGIPIAHIEAGLRSGDQTMPEENNRILTDHLSTWLFTTETAGNENLQKEAISPEKIHFVGNVMIDSLAHNLEKSRNLELLKKIGLAENTRFVLCTLHRNFNIQVREQLEKAVGFISLIAQKSPVLFPLHPHTEKCLRKFGLLKTLRKHPNLHILPPLGYLEFLHLTEKAALVLTDSGGVQEETTWLQVPCLTFRPNTERPVTITEGSNRLIYRETESEIAEIALQKIAAPLKKQSPPPFWDGKASERVAEILINAVSHA